MAISLGDGKLIRIKGRASQGIPDAEQSGSGGRIGAWRCDVPDAPMSQVDQVLSGLAGATAVVAGDRG